MDSMVSCLDSSTLESLESPAIHQRGILTCPSAWPVAEVHGSSPSRSQLKRGTQKLCSTRCIPRMSLISLSQHCQVWTYQYITHMYHGNTQDMNACIDMHGDCMYIDNAHAIFMCVYIYICSSSHVYIVHVCVCECPR